MNEFLSDITTIRARARAHIEQGPITESYGADRERVVEVLNQVLATELVCVLRYKRHHFTARGLEAGPVAEEFRQHAEEEMEHADMVARRITELQGEPDFDPKGLATRSHSEYVEGHGLMEMVREDLVAERVAVESYQEIIRWLGDGDPTSQQVMKTILAKEEEHADDLANLLERMDRGGLGARHR
jgi:bacterioferritin